MKLDFAACTESPASGWSMDDGGPENCIFAMVRSSLSGGRLVVGMVLLLLLLFLSLSGGRLVVDMVVLLLLLSLSWVLIKMFC